MAKATIKVGRTLKSKTRKLDKVNIFISGMNTTLITIVLLKLFGVI